MGSTWEERLAKGPSFDDALALADRDQLIGWQIGEGFESPGGPVDLDARFQCRPQARVQTRIVGGKKTALTGDGLCLRFSPVAHPFLLGESAPHAFCLNHLRPTVEYPPRSCYRWHWGAIYRV